jgi:hypothetical protein
MKIKELIQELLDMEMSGATDVRIVDTNWNECEIDGISQNASGKTAIIMIGMEGEDE